MPTPPPSTADGTFYVRVSDQVPAGLRVRSAPTITSDTLSIEYPGTYLKVVEAEATARPKIGVYDQWIRVRNPAGVEGNVFEGIKQGLTADRPAFLSGFLANFYNVDVLRGKRISDEAVRLSWNVAVGASPQGTLDCVSAWLTDFRPDLKRWDMPTLIVHGDDDRIVPLAVSGQRSHETIKGSRLVVVPGTPVYEAPALPYNYFYYNGGYYLYRERAWFWGASYNGPWTNIEPYSLPVRFGQMPRQYLRSIAEQKARK